MGFGNCLRVIEADLKVIKAQLASQAITLEKIMSGEDDLKAAVAGLQSFAVTVVTQLQALEAAAAAATGDPDADVETLAQSVNSAVATMKAALPASTPATPAAGS